MEDIVAICMRCADLPAPDVPSAQHLCSRCYTPVWVADSTPQWARFVCLECAARSMPPDSLSIITPAQLEELNSVGWTDEDVVTTAAHMDAWIKRGGKR